MKNLFFSVLGLIILNCYASFGFQNIPVNVVDLSTNKLSGVVDRNLPKITIVIKNRSCLKQINFSSSSGAEVVVIKADEIGVDSTLIIKDGKIFLSLNDGDFQNLPAQYDKFICIKKDNCVAQREDAPAQTPNESVVLKVTNNPWEDAIKLSDIIKKKPIESNETIFVNTIFKTYTGKNYQDFKSKDSTNSYFKDFFVVYDKLIKNRINDASGSLNEKDAASGEAGSAGFGIVTNPTMAIDALGTLIAERFKEELKITYLIKFKDFLKAQNGNWALFLPNTYAVLNNIENIYDFKPYLNTIQEATQEDAKAIPINLGKFLQKNPKKYPNYKQISLYLNMVGSILKENPAEKTFEILLNPSFLDSLSVDTSSSRQLRENIEMSLLIIKNFKKLDDDKPTWINLKETNKNIGVMPLFIGLVLEKEHLNKFITENVYKSMVTKGANFGNIQKWLIQTSELTQRITDYKSTLNSSEIKKDPKQLIETYGVYILKNAELLAHIFQTNYLNPMNANVVDKIVKRGEKTIQLVGNVVSKKYSLAISNLFEIIQDLKFEKYYANRNQEITDSLKLIADKKIDEKFKVQLLFSQKHLDSTNTSDLTAFKYLTFATNLAKAETSEEVKQALEAAALPVGSYRLKRNSSFSATINAFAGAYFGGEVLTKKSDSTSTSCIIAPTAPVGIHVGIGHTFGLYIPIVDVGGVATFRLNNEAALPELNWNNVLSPGIYTVFNLKNSPLTIMAGVQRGPELRRINIDDKKKTTAEFSTSAWRFGVSLTFDIPLFNVYSR